MKDFRWRVMMRGLGVGAALAWIGCQPVADEPAENEPVTDGGVSCAECLIIHDVTVIDGLGNPPVPRRSVIVRGDGIAAIEPAVSFVGPAGAEVIDGRGRFVVPGMIDMHAHVTILAIDENRRLAHAMERDESESVLRTLLGFGITTVRNPAAPAADAVALREAVASGETLGPEIRTAGNPLNRTRASFGPFVATKDADAVRAEVARQAALGVDYIKVYASLSPELVGAAIDAAHAHQLEVIGHLQRTTWTEAVRLGIDHVTHAAPWSAAYLPESVRRGYRGSIRDRMTWLESIEIEGAAIREMIASLAASRVSVDPTLIVLRTKFKGDVEPGLDHPDLAHAPAPVVEAWRTMSFTHGWTAEDFARGHRAWIRLLALVKAMWNGGVLLTAGSDMPNPGVVPGAGFHEELQLLGEAGIPPIEVLRIATSNAAIALGLDSKIGSVAVGKQADLVLLDADPLTDLANTRSIAFVVRDGEIYTPDDLLARPDVDP